MKQDRFGGRWNGWEKVALLAGCEFSWFGWRPYQIEVRNTDAGGGALRGRLARGQVSQGGHSLLWLLLASLLHRADALATQ